MKSSDLPKKSVSLLKSNNDAQELKAFNQLRACRGLQPVTQSEYDELTMKIATIWHANANEPTLH
jgi:hypothetical protein